MDILISTADCHKLSQESKELLCASCEMAQLRCAKLINVRGKVNQCTCYLYHEFCASCEILQLCCPKLYQKFIFELHIHDKLNSSVYLFI